MGLNADEVEDEDKFVLRDDDEYWLQLAEGAARTLLYDSRATPSQIVGLGRALYALGRLPKTSPGVDVTFGACYRNGGEHQEVDFAISEHRFGVSLGGSVYDPGIGHDSYTELSYSVEIGGYRETLGELYIVEDSFRELLNLGDVSVSDDSTADCLDEEE